LKKNTPQVTPQVYPPSLENTPRLIFDSRYNLVAIV